MIPEEVVEQVREAADIVAIIGEYVPLKRTGSDFRGPCPFHQGTRRNFSVVPAKRIYHCFVCGETGDVFRFLTKRLGMEWPEAVRMVGDKAGVQVPESRARTQGPDPREPAWELQATAAAYFQQMLWNEGVGAAARRYLEERAISRPVAEESGVGFAPREIGLMRSYMNALGFDDARLLDAGLLVTKDQDSEPRPRFRDRLMFPILDTLGRNVGFGGRLLGPGEPKYLNSSESSVFLKGKLLYGLNRSRNAIRRADRALVVEGYFDALRLVAAGVDEVVAPLGTALTEAQVTLLGKYSRNVFLLYDSDAAGLKATFRAGDELLRQKFSVRVVTLPPGEDPDSFVRASGAEGLEAALSSAIDVFDRKIQILDRAGWFGELQKKRRALDRLLPTIRATSDALMQDLYIRRASEVTGVDREILLREIGPTAGDIAPAASRAEPRRVATPAIRSRPGDRVETVADGGASAEKELVRAMLQQRSRVESIAERVGPDSFRNPRFSEIFAAMLQSDPEASIEDISAKLSADGIAVAEELLGDGETHVNPAKTIEDSLTRLHVRDMEDRMNAIDRLLPLGNDIDKAELDEERNNLIVQMRASGRGPWKAIRT